MKKILFTLMIALTSSQLVSLTSCGATNESYVYYLNFKPEQNEAWVKLAKKYQDQTGVKVSILTAGSGQYETTLQSEMAKNKAPTLFQLNGIVGYESWKDYCLDLTNTDIHKDKHAYRQGKRKNSQKINSIFKKSIIKEFICC